MAPSLVSHSHYVQFIYSLLADRPTIESHTLTAYTTGQTIGIVRGQVKFHAGYILRVFEQIDFLVQRILRYSYEVWRQDEQLWWYDPMPHPHIPELQSTHPHHKHVPPDIKHNRIPAPGISFAEPNLPYLIAEVEAHLSANVDPTSN
jgi:hypothetical protein